MARTSKKISQLDPAPGGPVAGDQFVIERGAVANYRIDWNAIVAAASAGVDGTFLDSSLNLSDLADVPTARANLGLGSAALLAAAAVLQAGNNLADVANVATARHSLGLDAVDAPTFAGLTLTAALLAPAGSIGAPGLAFSGEIGTGWGKLSPNSIGFVTSGAERARFVSVSAGGALDLVDSAGTFGASRFGMGPLGGADAVIARDAANTIALRRGVNAQTFRAYETFTDSANFSRMTQGFAGGTFLLGTEFAGTGQIRALTFLIGGSQVWQFNTNGHLLAVTDNARDIGASGANRPRNVFVAGVLRADGVLVATGNTATPAGGVQAIVLGTTSALGVYHGSGAPTVAAARGSLYIRTDGSATNNRAYINTDGAATWTPITTSA